MIDAPRTSRAALLAALLFTAACEGPTGVGHADARFDGDWRYHADVAGAATAIDGQLRLAGAQVGAIEGALDAEQVESTGARSALPGLVTGVVTADGVARLEVRLADGRVRTHYARVRGDSLVGEWIDSGARPATGAFRAARGTP